MNIVSLKDKILPPALVWRLNRKCREREELQKFTNLYSLFLSPGDLCFDIGANLGNRVACFRNMGCRVVALEPQPLCIHTLSKRFGKDKQTTIIPCAVASESCTKTMMTSPDHVLSSLSEKFIQMTTDSGRFASSRWDCSIQVNCTTLDELIRSHGLPAFIKIDVEGFESEVLAGLSTPVPAISIEWTPELPENTLTSIDHIESLGLYEYQVSWSESMRLSKNGWRSAEEIRQLIRGLSGETFFFADIYARYINHQ